MIPPFSLCWLAIVLTSFLNIAQAQDTVYSGNYEILFCGAGAPNSKTSQLQNGLPHILTLLQAVIADVKLGTKSPHGFAAFFKTNDNIATVQKVFQTIIDGPNVGLDDTNPLFACADPNQDLTKKVYADCLNRRIVCFAWPQYGVIFICPAFWNLNPLPFGSSCPRLGNNVLVPDNTDLSTNQFGIVIHELVHMYAPKLTAIDGETNEVYNVQAAVNLNAKDSLKNANNYALYAAAVVADCTNFPTMPKRSHDGVELRH